MPASHVYVNLQGSNPAGNTNSKAYVRDERAQPIIDSTSDYDCIVNRFSCPLSSIPLTICPILTGQSDINRTPCEVPITNLTVNTEGAIVVVGGVNNAIAIGYSTAQPLMIVVPAGKYSSVSLAAVLQAQIQSASFLFGTSTVVWNTHGTRFVITLAGPGGVTPSLYYFYGSYAATFPNSTLAVTMVTEVHGKYWAMSNSDTPRIRALYGDWCDIMVVGWNYASAHGEGKELLIRPRF
jgi:hypothetical protein